MKKAIAIASLLVTSLAANAQVVNIQGNLDNWRNYGAGLPPTQLTAPNGWFSADSLIFAYGPLLGTGPFVKQMSKDAASHSGAFAAVLTTKDQGPDFGVITGLLTNAKPGVDLANFDPTDPMGSLTYTGGTPVTERINVVSAWVKYIPVNSDVAIINVQAVQTGQGQGGSDLVVGEAEEQISVQNSYTKVLVNLNYTDATIKPDKLLISITSSDPANPEDGSVLYVDDIEAIGASGVHTVLFGEQTVKLYPVPARDILHISTELSQPLIWQAYAQDGKLVAQQQFTKKTKADISHLSGGVYIYNIHDMNGNAVQQGKFNVE